MEEISKLRVGADVGGTFTDVVLADEHGRVWKHKTPSTPPHFEFAVLGGIAHVLRERQSSRIRDHRSVARHDRSD